MPWTPLIGALLIWGTSLAGATPMVSCEASACADQDLVAAARSAVRDKCPCGSAASGKAFRKCWKPVVTAFAKAGRKDGFSKTCRKDVTRALANSTCGRKGVVLCRKNTRKGQACQVTKASKCGTPVDAGKFGSCADTCDQLVAEAFPTTVELPGGDVASVESDVGGVLRFNPAPAALAAVQVGSVIVGGVGPNTPAGLLRVVLAVERDGEVLVLKTAQAPIQLAYKKLHVRFVRSLLATPPATPAVTSVTRAAVAASRPFDFVLFDGDGSDVTTNDRVAIEGTVGGGFDFDFALDVDWGGIDSLPDVVTNCLKSLVGVLVGDPPRCSIDDLLPEARVTFVVLPEVNADANVRGAAILSYEKEVDLASETLTPITIGPLVFVPVADITAALSGGASGQFSTGVHGSALFETSVTVSSKQTEAPRFKSPVLRETDFGPNDTTVTLHADAKIGVGGRLNLLLFGVTGPYATARAYAAIEGDILGTPCWALHTGIDADLGVKVTSPALPIIGQVTLADWRAPTVNPLDLELATGACDAPPGQSTLPPGSGPDAARLANPTYTPWARSYTSSEYGALAGPGNGVPFSGLERTIDGHYVRSGYFTETLVKFDGDGRLLWARDFDMDGGRLYPVRVRSSSDATMTMLSRTITAPLVLTRVAQDGTALDGRGYDVPLDACNVDPTALAPDGAGGAWIGGYCVGGVRTFLLHAGRDTTSLWLLDAEFIRLKVVEAIGRDAFVAGSVGLEEALFALRITPEGSVVYSKRYDACPAAPDAIPSAAIVGPQGEVTIAGSGGAQHNGTLVRILPDGGLGFARFPGFGFGVGSVFVLDSLAELPTTGFVAGGSHVQFVAQEPDNVPSTALVGFDAAGHIQWAKRYSFGGPGAYAAAGQVAVRPSDDGGVVATAVVSDPADPLGGRLWAFKPFVKNGDITFLPGAATALPLAISELDCTMTASDVAIPLTSLSLSPRSVPVASTPVALDVARQTAE